MLLSDTDIIKLLDKEIIIDPLEEKSVTPVGYDLRVGEFVYSLRRGLLTPDHSGRYRIQPGEAILILTKEFVWVSNHIGGTFHSKVSMVSRGFSHIGTTLDPGWIGPLLIATSNVGDKELTLSVEEPFVTLLFYRTKSRATRSQQSPPARRDILLQLLVHPATDAEKDLAQNVRELTEKVSQTIKGVEAQKDFYEKVRRAGEQGLPKVLRVARGRVKLWRARHLFILVHIVLLALIVLLPVYLDTWLKPAFPRLFSTINVDSTFFAGALGAAIFVLLSLINLLNKE